MKNTGEPNPKEGKERIGSDLNLFAMSKESLIKRVQILMHELAVYHRYEEEKEILSEKDDQNIRKELVQKDIIIEQLKKNEVSLQNALKAKTKNLECLVVDGNEKDALIASLKKENESLKKKMAIVEKSKLKEYTEKIDILTKEYKIRQDNLEEENKRLKKNVQELSNKVKILNELNEETEEKLANTIISKKVTKLFPQQQQQPKGKENMDSNKPQPNLKLQNLSLKDQIRKLKQDLHSCQQSKQTLKSRFHERQLFYSRMISLKQ